MTRVNPRVMDGQKIKLRLQQRRAENGSHVSIDWLRFTVDVKSNLDYIFPPDLDAAKRWHKLNADTFFHELHISRHSEFHAVQAKDLADNVCEILGPDYYVDACIKKGHDFYKYRASIMREGHECGWVGFLASSENEKQKKQENTLHVNLYGHACTFAKTGWELEMKKLIDWRAARITRCDLALDIFESEGDLLERTYSDYQNGLMNVRGVRPKVNMLGNWTSHDTGSRSFYVGSKKAGKQTNIYEKGHQLFGQESGSTWVRVELRWGNQLRVLSSELLSRPADFFAGASDWHANILREQAQKALIAPEPIKCTPRLQIETVQAEIHRNVKWLFDVAAPSIAKAFEYAGDSFLELVIGKEKPGRLKKFNEKEIRREYQTVFSRIAGACNSASMATAH